MAARSTWKGYLQFRPAIERLEAREAPSAAPWVSQSFDSTPVGALPSNWSQWSSSPAAAFAVSSAIAFSPPQSLDVSAGVSSAMAQAWYNAPAAADVQVSAEVQVSTLIPAQVFARGTGLGTSSPSYYAAAISRGLELDLVRVVNGVSTTLATVLSANWFSDTWAQVTLSVSGTTLQAQVLRPDTNQYLNAAGRWQATQTWALTVTDTALSGPGNVGLARPRSYTGTVAFDDFTANPLGVAESFDSTPVGALPSNWSQWSSTPAAAFAVSSAFAFSPPQSLDVSAGVSSAAAQAWYNTPAAADVQVSAEVLVSSLIPAQIFARGTGLGTLSPSYYAAAISRGLELDLVRVVNGVSTTLATVLSATWFSDTWAQVTLTVSGTTLLAQVLRPDTNQYLNAAGQWQATQTWALTVTDTVLSGPGNVGLARPRSYTGTVAFDNFTAYPQGALTPPAAPSFTATAFSAAQINLAWTGVPGATGFLVDELFNGAWLPIASLGSGSTSFSVTGLSASTTYAFIVGAANAAGTTWANAVSATTGVAVNNPAAAAAYSAVSGVLFGPGGPSYLDVEQGVEGDCWLMVSLAEVAARDPADIQNMFTAAGTTVVNGSVVSLYTVRFFNNAGVAEYFTVDTELPAGGGYYDHPVNGILWVALAEKAYAEANGAGMVTSGNEGSDSYSALNVGDPAWALRAITGKPATDFSINPTNIAAAWNAGQLIVLCTTTPPSSYIVPDHCYAVVGYTASSSQPFQVYNPWGTTSAGWALSTYNGNQVYGLFNTNATFLAQNFATQSIGTGTAGSTMSLSGASAAGSAGPLTAFTITFGSASSTASDSSQLPREQVPFLVGCFLTGTNKMASGAA